MIMSVHSSIHIARCPLPSLETKISSISAAHRPRRRERRPPDDLKQSATGFGAKRPEQLWRCVEGCGACCKLDKGPSFATPEEIFTDPCDIELYRSLVGPDGWCVHYDKSTRKCSIYSERPYFCRVEAPVFLKLYGIPQKKFNKEACSSCRDTIKAIYGPNSMELDNFNRSVTDST
ncbi:uncharacterized protein LOC8283861 [Ricinus communis]|uniref:Flagellin N-methylase n=1 Tax=Ricinus communis TaxID=3988 RepID=B9SGV1_RICCO|nr:uncharacterized protein LOC8283861 [Ricinus communis]XP_025014231.1 uncharacterized protein LOC8283861 [Ricinus communis]EEF37186.1 conserved hypothetical protein [Ricinus communis]|eukprot:XP_025014230.1 uncharacterized protein LOC8283861 [Ricinus communis]